MLLVNTSLILIIKFTLFSISFAQNSKEIELKAIIENTQKYCGTSPEQSLEYAKKAESIAIQSGNQNTQAKVYTLLDNLYGLKLDYSYKVADYHQKAFLIYDELFGQNQITPKHFYNFFSKNVAPIYELISSESYNLSHRDRKAIRKYQELYTELSRFFLNNSITPKEGVTLDKINVKNIVSYCNT